MKQRGLDSYAHVWTGNFDRRPGDPARCRAAVHDDSRAPTFHQCGRKPVVFRELAKGTFGFCKQHDPVAVRERREAADHKAREEWKRTTNHWTLAEQRAAGSAACTDALRKIEAGHNDPRQLAREVLTELDRVEAAIAANLNPNPGGVCPAKQE